MKKQTISHLERAKEKTSRIPIKIIPRTPIKKPEWIKMQLPKSEKFHKVKSLLKKNHLNTVCEEASCPNIGECFSHGTATFMILGDLCTRRCPFCDVAHGKPNPVDTNEPENLANAIATLELNYVVITSVDRDDLKDGGAEHFKNCITEIKNKISNITIEILVPDFRGRLDKAVDILSVTPPDVFNHNLETVPSLYKRVRPGSDYLHSLTLLKRFKERNPSIPTKSGIMLGLGESYDEIIKVLNDLKQHKVEMVTIGQYLQPTLHHLSVERYLAIEEFNRLEKDALALGFKSVACGPMVRSSYHADLQAIGKVV